MIDQLLQSYAVVLMAGALVGLCAVALFYLTRDMELKLPHDPVDDLTERIIWRKRR